MFLNIDVRGKHGSQQENEGTHWTYARPLVMEIVGLLVEYLYGY